MKIVASIDRPCHEAKNKHKFSYTNGKEDFSLNPKP
jgi:hypothetical protein